LLYAKVWKFDLEIYIRNIKHCTDIDPTVDFVFPVNKIDRENNEKKVSWTNLKLTKCVLEGVTFETFQRTKYVFTSKDHCNMQQLFIVTSLRLLLPVKQTIFFGVDIFNPQKKNPQKLNVLFLVKNRRNYRLYCKIYGLCFSDTLIINN
jgi:hypothetical protein